MTRSTCPDPNVYRIRKPYEGAYEILAEDDEIVARVSKFNPGPMVSLSSMGGLFSPPLARAVAKAMTKLANELERDKEPGPPSTAREEN